MSSTQAMPRRVLVETGIYPRPGSRYASSLGSSNPRS
jgi:hypothetical protein